MEVHELSQYDAITVNGERHLIYEHQIVDMGGWHAVIWTTQEGKMFETPITGYNEQAGYFWDLEWDHTTDWN